MNPQDQNADNQEQEIEYSAVSPNEFEFKGLTPPQLHRMAMPTLKKGLTPPALQQMPVVPMNEGVTPTALQQMTPPSSASPTLETPPQPTSQENQAKSESNS